MSDPGNMFLLGAAWGVTAGVFLAFVVYLVAHWMEGPKQ